ncbi:MAG: adenosylmethionine--8-amino-7-oxononanoate transaminase [Gammaproteobacteria bacterium]|nr:adenosylmethionine--8-amino-7-oxononanoate transaminase [Gammaproteobacteria bacterium]
MSNTDWSRRSRARVWHPCTQMKDHERLPLVPVARAEGVWLEDFEGKRYLDAISSWWTNLFGHRHPHIVARLKAQLEELDHVLLAGFTHAPVVTLSEKLCALAPKGLTRCFYADNGSSAVEVALKMSFHYWRNVGKPEKRRFIALANSYHGETLGALAVGGAGLYRDTYEPLLMQPIHVPSPDCHDRAPGEAWEDYSLRQFQHMERALEQHAHEVCAVIVEPLVQAAAGMRMYHPAYLKRLREACTRHGVHLIADEIAVGFGRTGRMFACEWSGISPDLMCLSKGLTGGTLPLAVTLATEAIYEAFYDEYQAGKAFLHSHSYTGNPLACAAALATLEIFGQRDWMAQNRQLGHLMWMGVSELSRHPHVAEIRQQGMILAIELARNVARRTPYPAAERRGLRVYQHALQKGVLLRPLGNVVYFMPPYVISPEEIGLLARVVIEGVQHTTRDG